LQITAVNVAFVRCHNLTFFYCTTCNHECPSVCSLHQTVIGPNTLVFGKYKCYRKSKDITPVKQFSSVIGNHRQAIEWSQFR